MTWEVFTYLRGEMQGYRSKEKWGDIGNLEKMEVKEANDGRASQRLSKVEEALATRL